MLGVSDLGMSTKLSVILFVSIVRFSRFRCTAAVILL